MKTVDISGVGGELEFICQKMLMAGINFLKDHPQLVQKKILTDEMMQLGRELDEVVVAAMGEAFSQSQIAHPTFDMVMKHLAYIKTHGLKKWFEDVTVDEPERVFEFDGTLESIPKVLRTEATLEKDEAPQPTEEEINSERNAVFAKAIEATNEQFKKAGKSARVSIMTSVSQMDSDEADIIRRAEEEVAIRERLYKSVEIPKEKLSGGATTAFEALMETDANEARAKKAEEKKDV